MQNSKLNMEINLKHLFHLLREKRERKSVKKNTKKCPSLFFFLLMGWILAAIKSDPPMNKYPISSLEHMNHNAGYRIGSTSHIYKILYFHIKHFFVL